MRFAVIIFFLLSVLACRKDDDETIAGINEVPEETKEDSVLVTRLSKKVITFLSSELRTLTFTYRYDSHDRIVEIAKDYSDGLKWDRYLKDFEYDDEYRIKNYRVVDSYETEKNRYEFFYNLMGKMTIRRRMTTEENWQKMEEYYKYDSEGRQIGYEKFRDGYAIEKRLDYRHDSIGRVIGFEIPYWNGQGTDSIVIDYNFNGDTLSRIEYSVSRDIFKSEEYNYDSEGRKMGLEKKKYGDPYYRAQSFMYNLNGDLVHFVVYSDNFIEDPLGSRIVDFEYDVFYKRSGE